MMLKSVIRKANNKNRLSTAVATKLTSGSREMQVNSRLESEETINHQVVVAVAQQYDEQSAFRRLQMMRKRSSFTSKRLSMIQLPLISTAAARIKRCTQGSAFLLLVLISSLLATSSDCKMRISNGASLTDLELSALFTNQLDEAKVQQTLQAFDASPYQSVYEAIRNHEELREFAKLCDSPEVKEIVSVTKIPLTVFAPIDRSLSDLLSKSKSRSSINLVELARHHMAPILVTPDEHTKFPLQFSSYPRLSPLYLNQVQVQPASAGRSSQQQVLYVNNARILASHLIPIGDSGDTFQALHIIDQPLDYAYSSRRTQVMRNTGGPQHSGLAARGNKQQVVTQRRSLNLDELSAGQSSEQPLVDYYETFADILAQSTQADLFKTRVYRGIQPSPAGRISLERNQLASLERLAQAARRYLPEMRGHLYQVNESSSSSASLNTYFVPVDSEELRSLVQQQDPQVLANNLRALMIPNQVLFTRAMQLGHQHATSSPRLALSLAKSLPAAAAHSTSTSRFLATPLLLQAECYPPSAHEDTQAASSRADCPAGVSSAEILVANIPLSHGVLHLIKRPLLWSHNNLLDYLNGDVDAELVSQVNSVGSRTKQPAALEQQLPVSVNRFRELLSRERQLLSLHANGNQLNMTILVPSDEAFNTLRFDLRALVNQDESMIPRDWDQAYRTELLEKLVRRHIILHSLVTSDRILQEAERAQQPLFVGSDNGKQLSFSQDQAAASPDQLQVQCDSERARFLHRDLIASNGVLHIIERVLGEQQETVHSLLRSIMLRLASGKNEEVTNELSTHDQHLAELISSNLRDLSNQQQQQQQQQQQIITSESPQSVQSAGASSGLSKDSEELALISKSIGQYLDGLSGSKRQVVQALASSVNISYKLARLISQAEGSADWNEKLGEPDNLFTYFVPSDLAWLRLQQAQPELYKPLTHFLELHLQEPLQVSSDSAGAASPLTVDATSSPSSSPKSPRSSKSSHRLRQILERHLVVNRKIAKKDLSQLDSLETLGATLRLADPAQQQQLSANPIDGLNGHLYPNSPSAAAAIQAQENEQTLTGKPPMRLKSLRLGEFSSANIVQVNEASNGFVYIIDNVLIQPDDSDFILQTSSSPAVSSTMSSLLGAHNSAILDFFQGLFTPSPFNMSAQSVLILIGSLTVAITLLLLLALVLVMRRRCQSKLNRHQQLESGLTSASSANSGSTSTTKSL